MVPFPWCSKGQNWKHRSLESKCSQAWAPRVAFREVWKVCNSSGPAQGSSPPLAHELFTADTNTTLEFYLAAMNTDGELSKDATNVEIGSFYKLSKEV